MTGQTTDSSDPTRPAPRRPEDGPPACEFEARSLLPRMEITVSARVSEISPAVDRIMKVVSRMECSKGKDFEIRTGLQEALANAVVHGCGQDPDKKVQICVGTILNP